MTLLALGSAAKPRLEDAEIEELLRDAFAAHRCAVRFEKDDRGVRHRVSLMVYVSRVRSHLPDRELSVEGVSVESLRSPEALKNLIRDVREQLQLAKGGPRARRTTRSE